MREGGRERAGRGGEGGEERKGGRTPTTNYLFVRSDGQPVRSTAHDMMVPVRILASAHPQKINGALSSGEVEQFTFIILGRSMD